MKGDRILKIRIFLKKFKIRIMLPETDELSLSTTTKLKLSTWINFHWIKFCKLLSM